MDIFEGSTRYSSGAKFDYSLLKLTPTESAAAVRCVPDKSVMLWLEPRYGLANKALSVVVNVGRSKRSNTWIVFMLVKTAGAKNGCYSMVKAYNRLATEQAAVNMALWLHMLAQMAGWDSGAPVHNLQFSLFLTAINDDEAAAASKVSSDRNMFFSGNG